MDYGALRFGGSRVVLIVFVFMVLSFIDLGLRFLRA